MRYIWQHIVTITEAYDGSLPLTHFLKNYFRLHPVLGSRDRRIINAMTYAYYRCGKGVDADAALEVRMKKCLELCNSELAGNTRLFDAGNDTAGIAFEINSLFPYYIELSEGIDKQDWLTSMLMQPDLFIRVRKNKEKVMALLEQKEIPVTVINGSTLSLPNGAKIDSLLPEDAYAVQDASSQYTGTFFKPKKNEQWYDCCSGAGGKSLLLKDMEPEVKLTVSDKRESIIHNLKQRFRLYGHQLPVALIADVSNREQLSKALGNAQFDNIICDAPCSGSGTWARTPEQLYFFNPSSVGAFSRLQRSIVANVVKYLKPGGRLIYITCSVFRNENEDVVASIVKDTDCELITAQLINGIGIHADSMFVAVLRKGLS